MWKQIGGKKDFLYLFCDECTIPGTAYGPKCIKIPILASSYQSGNGLESKLSQSGVYLGVLRLSMLKLKADFPRIRTNIYDNFKKLFILGCIFCLVFNNAYKTMVKNWCYNNNYCQLVWNDKIYFLSVTRQWCFSHNIPRHFVYFVIDFKE